MKIGVEQSSTFQWKRRRRNFGKYQMIYKDLVLFVVSDECNNPIFRYFYFYLFNMCLYMFVCDYLSLGVFSWVFVLEWYFGLLVSKGNLVIP